MSYTPTTWVDNKTPVNAANLNKLEKALQDTSAAVDEINNARASGEFKGEQGEPGPQGDTGPQGDPGPEGPPGPSPVRGIDYWTPEDIAEIKSYVDEAILGGAW